MQDSVPFCQGFDGVPWLGIWSSGFEGLRSWGLGLGISVHWYYSVERFLHLRGSRS